jgi:hypothetical protein
MLPFPIFPASAPRHWPPGAVESALAHPRTAVSPAAVAGPPGPAPTRARHLYNSILLAAAGGKSR